MAKLSSQVKQVAEGLHYSTQVRAIDEKAGVRRIRMGIKENCRLIENILNPNHPTPNPKTDDDRLILDECKSQLNEISEKLLVVNTSLRGSNENKNNT